MTDLDHRMDIIWRRGNYYLSVPNYQGGTVYTKEYVDGVLAQLANAQSQLVNADDALDRLMGKVGGKLAQLHHYRDNDCKLEHARIVAEGRILQSEQVLAWINEEIETRDARASGSNPVSKDAGMEGRGADPTLRGATSPTLT